MAIRTICESGYPFNHGALTCRLNQRVGIIVKFVGISLNP